MGIPDHYSRDLPGRCLHLIERLWPQVKHVAEPGAGHLGPLTTTFLLAMATPIICLPIERIQRHLGSDYGYMNDRELDPDLRDEIGRVFRLARLDRAPFFESGSWHYVEASYQDQNLAVQAPYQLLESLASRSAIERAAGLSVDAWASCLRNSIAHGGILYLDANGQQPHGAPTERLAFVSARYPDGNTRNRPSHLKLLSISEIDFSQFLREWVHWLNASGLSSALAA
jgi:hypothetical protein